MKASTIIASTRFITASQYCTNPSSYILKLTAVSYKKTKKGHCPDLLGRATKREKKKQIKSSF